MRRLAVALFLLPALLGLVGCGGDEPEAAPSGSPTTEDPGSSACRRLLPDDAARALAGTTAKAPVDTEVGNLDACRWDLGVGEWIQVVDVPAAEWAAQLPALIDQVKASGQFDKATMAKLEEGRQVLESGKKLTPAQACGLFTTLVVEIQHQPKGSDHVVNFVPNPTSPQAVNAQRCVGGRYTSVQLVSADLQGNRSETQRALTALEAVTS